MNLKNKEIMEKYWFFNQGKFMTFGFECGEGWYPLLEELCEKIDNIIKEKYVGLREDFQVLQVKEKFGELRFYTSCSVKEIDDLINEYSAKSINICETCGKKGVTKNIRGWYKTLCKECEYELTKT